MGPRAQKFLWNFTIRLKGKKVPLKLNHRAKGQNLFVGPKGEELPLKLIYRAQGPR